MDQQSRDVIPEVEPTRPAPEAPFSVGEQLGTGAVTEQTGAASVELPAAQAGVSQALAGQPVIQQSAPQAVQPLQQQGAGPAIADDADLIEKEWVVKAKEIVAQTKHDPYVQTKEVSKMKADYLRKRYNKDLKISQDQ